MTRFALFASLLVAYLKALLAVECTVEGDHLRRAGRYRLLPDEVVGEPGVPFSKRAYRPVDDPGIGDDHQFRLEQAIEHIGDRGARKSVAGLESPGDVDEDDVGDVERRLPL